MVLREERSFRQVRYFVSLVSSFDGLTLRRVDAPENTSGHVGNNKSRRTHFPFDLQPENSDKKPTTKRGLNAPARQPLLARAY